MKTRLLYCCSILLPCFLVGVTAVSAEDLLAKAGRPTLEDGFDSPTLSKHWRIAIGDFHIEDGNLIGNEKAEDKHGAVARVQTKLNNGIVQFDFRMGDVKTFNFAYDQRGFKGSHAGHICRVVVNRSMLRLSDDKEGSMKNEVFELRKDPSKKAEADKLIQGRAVTIKTSIDPDTWHTLRVATIGDVMQVSLDGKFVGELKSSGIAHEEKTDIGFTVIGQGARFDNFRIWEVTE